jgi:hypothetical protein
MLYATIGALASKETACRIMSNPSLLQINNQRNLNSVQLRVQKLLDSPGRRRLKGFFAFFFTLKLPNHEAMDVSVSKATSTLTRTLTSLTKLMMAL